MGLPTSFPLPQLVPPPGSYPFAPEEDLSNCSASPVVWSPAVLDPRHPLHRWGCPSEATRTQPYFPGVVLCELPRMRGLGAPEVASARP